MRCIFCLERSDNATRTPHAFPQAIGKNEFILPRGAECDGCNAYVGDLENCLISQPYISLVLQLLRIPGSKGRPRVLIGNAGISDDGKSVVMPVADATIGNDGASARPIVHKNFDLDRFRRALHRVAFGMYAYSYGVEAALAHRFNAVRRYVRFNEPPTPWPFAQQGLPEFIESRVGAYFQPKGGALLVRLEICELDFAVDLLNSGALEREYVTVLSEPSLFVAASESAQLDRTALNRRRTVRLVMPLDGGSDI